MVHRALHPEDGMVFACPGCDNAPVHRRESGDCVCYQCGWSGPEPNERPARGGQPGGRAPKGPRTDIGQALVEADPDDLGGQADG